MTSRDLVAVCDAVAEAPNGLVRLRELVLQLAVRGKLVPQDPSDEPASALLERIAAEKARMVTDGEIRESTKRQPTALSNIPFDVPKGWEWVPLGRYCHVEMGQSPPSADYNTTGDGLPFFQGKADFGLTYPTARYWCTRPTKLARPGDVLLSVRAPIGPTNIADVGCCIGRGLAALRPLASVPPRFLLWTVRAFAVDLEALGTGTTFAAISRGSIDPFLVPVPPLAEQHRILARLDELMGLLNQLEVARRSRDATRAAVRDSILHKLRQATVIEEVEVAWERFAEWIDNLLIDPTDIPPVRQTVLELAVRGHLVPQESAAGTADDVIQAVRHEKDCLAQRGLLRRQTETSTSEGDNAPFAIPETWRWAQAADICLIITDGDHQPPPQVTDGIPFLVIGDVSRGRIDVTATRKVPVAYFDALDWTRKPNQGDLLYTVTGSFGIVLEVGHVGPFCVQRHIGIIKTARSVDNRYLAYALRSPHAFEYATRVATGTAQKTVPLSGLRRLPIPVPPLAEQQRIVARVDELMGLIDRLEERLTTVRTKHAAFAAAAVHHLDA
jgi:type I restriction enzyme, S subunit